jgi:hypothetical protein
MKRGGQDSSGSGQEKMTGDCYHDHDTSDLIKCVEIMD